MEQVLNRRSLGLYIHIPFCERKCNYCDFLSAPHDEETKRRYVDALLTEINSYKGTTEHYQVKTIFIGGGTPSSIKGDYITDILNTVYDVFDVAGHQRDSKKKGFFGKMRDKKTKDLVQDNDEQNAEITIEINPGSITGDKLLQYKKAGINRISIGLQSTNDEELKLLGRVHNYETFLNTYELVRKINFRNVNIDLMSAIPGQTVESWEDTLRKVVALNPEHISAYSLIIEDGTPFYELYGEGKDTADVKLPDEETDRLMYKRTKEILKDAGYDRYEISNYSKINYECKHNISYWIGTEYLGIGLGASSLLHNARFHNMTDIDEYIRICFEYKSAMEAVESKKKRQQKDDFGGFLDDHIGIRRDIERLVESQRMEEFMYLGLRRMEGISKSEFRSRFGKQIETVYGVVINRLVNQNLLVNQGDRIYLTDYGIDVSNIVLAEFLLGEFVRC